MDKLKLEKIKTAAGLVVSFGVGEVVANLIKTTTPKNAKTLGLMLAGVGGLALSVVLGQAASNQLDGMIDEAVEVVEETKAEMEKQLEEVKG